MTNERALTRISKVYRLFIADLREMIFKQKDYLNGSTTDFLRSTMMYAENRMRDILSEDYMIDGEEIARMTDLQIIFDILLGE